MNVLQNMKYGGLTKVLMRVYAMHQHHVEFFVY